MFVFLFCFASNLCFLQKGVANAECTKLSSARTPRIHGDNLQQHNPKSKTLKDPRSAEFAKQHTGEGLEASKTRTEEKVQNRGEVSGRTPAHDYQKETHMLHPDIQFGLRSAKPNKYDRT